MKKKAGYGARFLIADLNVASFIIA